MNILKGNSIVLVPPAAHDHHTYHPWRDFGDWSSRDYEEVYEEYAPRDYEDWSSRDYDEDYAYAPRDYEDWSSRDYDEYLEDRGIGDQYEIVKEKLKDGVYFVKNKITGATGWVIEKGGHAVNFVKAKTGLGDEARDYEDYKYDSRQNQNKDEGNELGETNTKQEENENFKKKSREGGYDKYGREYAPRDYEDWSSRDYENCEYAPRDYEDYEYDSRDYEDWSSRDYEDYEYTLRGYEYWSSRSEDY